MDRRRPRSSYQDDDRGSIHPALNIERAYKLTTIDPSSTRAELLANAACLSELTPYSAASIYSDSQAAIAAIRACMANIDESITPLPKHKDRVLLFHIRQMTHHYHITLFLEWVKGHAQSVENNRAYWLATSAYTLDTSTDLSHSVLPAIMHEGARTEPTCQGYSWNTPARTEQLQFVEHVSYLTGHVPLR
jgi:ribonuclease HI